MNYTYNFVTIASCFVLSGVLFAQDVHLHKLGQSVDLDARAPSVDVTPAVPRPGHESILSRFKIAPGHSSPTSHLLSGKIVSDNTGAGVERVALYIGADGKAPSLAAMTNADGEFKFRLWIKKDGRSSNLSVPSFDGFLYVGGYPSKTYRNRLRLMSGYSIRYKLKDLADAIDSKIERTAEERDSQKRSQTTETNTQSPRPGSPVERFVGVWRWHYADSATYHMELMRDGNAKMYRGRNVISSSGRWNSPDGKTLILKLENPASSEQVCHKGMRPQQGLLVALMQKSTRKFKPDINDEEELMEIAALPSEADMPWRKVNAISESLRN
jgi:hypothetical protein